MRLEYLLLRVRQFLVFFIFLIINQDQYKQFNNYTFRVPSFSFSLYLFNINNNLIDRDPNEESLSEKIFEMRVRIEKSSNFFLDNF